MMNITDKALLSEIDPLLEEGYTVTLSKSPVKMPDYDGLVYRVTVMDGEIVVTSADSGILSEALADVYSSTPERGKR